MSVSDFKVTNPELKTDQSAPLHIIGSGGLGSDLVACFRDEIVIAGFWDDGAVKGSTTEDVSVLGNIDDLLNSRDVLNVVIAVGNTLLRKTIFDKIKKSHHNFQTLIHSTAGIFNKSSVVLNEGVIIFPGAHLTTRINIGENCLIHIGCSLHHDVYLGAHSVMMPGSRITGNAIVGNEVFMKANTAVTNGMKIGNRESVG
jgi:NDP-sugar pyrophosphorylase family protein